MRRRDDELAPPLLPFWLWWCGAVLGVGSLLFCYHYLSILTMGATANPLRPLINEMTAAFGAGLLFFPVRELCRRLPLSIGTLLRRLPVYALALVGFSALHTTSNWGLRELLYRLAGFGDYNYGHMSVRYWMEFPVDILAFTTIVGAVHAAAALRAARARQIRTARLEASLAQAQVRSLRLQLQPHFLFNALNTISATMYRDLDAADEIIDRLAELLRASLATGERDLVPLETELEALGAYVAIMRARFGERVKVEIEAQDEDGAALVPAMILQPLVENAVRHGKVEESGHGSIRVRAVRAADRLLLEVEDDGPGAAPGQEVLGAGLGLSATAERLDLLFGDDATFEAGNRAAGGFRVRVTFPLRLAEVEAP